jgi:hypothetical protein
MFIFGIILAKIQQLIFINYMYLIVYYFYLQVSIGFKLTSSEDSEMRLPSIFNILLWFAGPMG